MEYLRKKERIMRSMINPSPKGDPNLLESPKSFVAIAVNWDTFIRIAKNERRSLIPIPSLRRNMMMHSLKVLPFMQVMMHG